VAGLVIAGMIGDGMIVFGELVAAPRDTSPDVIVVVVVIVIGIGLGGDDRTFTGFAWNLARQLPQQKKYSLSLCSVLKRAVAGFTSIPQTGSLALAADGAALRGSIDLVASNPWCNLNSEKQHLKAHFIEGVSARLKACPDTNHICTTNGQIALGGIQPLLDTQRVNLEPY
jgi:hypothetical protein